MSRLTELMASYKHYHSNPTNTYCHFVGVPVVTFSLFLFLAWFRFIAPAFPVSLAQIFFVGTMIHYFRIDREIAMYVFFLFGVLLILAEIAARFEFVTSFYIFLTTFILGWVFQLVGHYFEGKRPALVDNLLQVFNAPLFVVLEALFLMGHKKDLESQIESLTKSV